MNKLYVFFGICVVIFPSSTFCADKASISFPSDDGIEITADTYFAHDEPSTPVIVLFHQAGWSRDEYLEIAPKLNMLGFNCIAIDQRSGEAVNGVVNETASRAIQANKNTQYIDALPDMETALRYANTQYSKSKIIAWGSSYSAALVLQIAGSHPKLVDGVLAFAPGEYFTKQGKSKSWIHDAASNINVPVFITLARDEQKNWSAIYAAIPYKNKSLFIPTSKGNHGSRALWQQFDNNQKYWSAVQSFLSKNFL